MRRTPTTRSTFAGVILLPCLFCPAIAQLPSMQPPPAMPAVPAKPLAFELADVHASPRSTATSMDGGWLDGDRYIVHHATMLNLISNAYGVQTRKILGGQSWLDTDRYDIVARVPSGTSDDAIKGMLRNLLADRFKLVVHSENKLLPAILITAPTGSSRIVQSGGFSTPGCKYQQPPDALLAQGKPVTFSCHAESMAAFAEFLQVVMSNNTQPEVDATGLKGLWDFDFKALYPPRTSPDSASNLKAIESQLGLRAEPGTALMPVLIVDSVNKTPAPNPPGIAAVLPPPPPTKFDVVTIKPSSADKKELMGQMGGGQIDVTGITLQFLINVAWDFDKSSIANAPKWLNQDKFDILAKVLPPNTAAGPTSAPDIDNADFQRMTKKLLEDRFGLRWHMEDRPIDAFVLLTVNPTMKKADPLYHSGCVEGPGPDGIDPRVTRPILGRLISCQNTTMAQLAEQLPVRSTGYIKIPTFDATGLTGAFDFVLSFSGYSQVGGINEWSVRAPGDTAEHIVVPPGGLLMFDAIKQQLGLKLERRKHSIPMLVIDHIDEKPTEH